MKSIFFKRSQCAALPPCGALIHGLGEPGSLWCARDKNCSALGGEAEDTEDSE